MNSQQKQNPAKRPEANIHGLVKEISDAVCQDNSFALDAGRKLYHYQNGVYKPNQTWECESLRPDYLVEQVKAAIEANMDRDIYRDAAEREAEEPEELADIRSRIIDDIQL